MKLSNVKFFTFTITCFYNYADLSEERFNMQNSRWLGRGRGRPQSTVPVPPISIDSLSHGLIKRVQSQDDLIYQQGNFGFMQMQTALPLNAMTLNASNATASQMPYAVAQPLPSKLSGLNLMSNQAGAKVFQIYA